MNFPFSQIELSENKKLRTFSGDVSSSELVWHMDEEDREVVVVESNSWYLQMDNEVPVLLEEGKSYFIPKMTYHRVIKGKNDLIIQITEEKKPLDYIRRKKMSNNNLTKQEIMWLMESYAPVKENCGGGQDPCITHGAPQEQSNVTITGQPDHEVSMASRELNKTARYAQDLAVKMDLAGEANLPAWVQSKITKATDYISKVYHYLEEYLETTEVVVAESAEGEIKKASHDIEIDITISDADMKKIHDGEIVTLKDKAGSNTFVVNVKA